MEVDILKFQELVIQAALAVVFYVCVVLLFRIAGKRLAGQTTTFDLVILISLGVALQKVTLHDGVINAAIFTITTFAIHIFQTWLSASSQFFRYLIRGEPSCLIRNGQVNNEALNRERLTRDELQAGLRKLGIERIEDVKTAHIEETGQISAILLSDSKKNDSHFR